MISVSSIREEPLALLYHSPHSIPRGQPFVSLHTLGKNVLTIAVNNKCRVRDILQLACTECRIAQEKLFGVAVRVPSEGVGCDSPRNEYLFLDRDQFLHKYIGKQSRLRWVGNKGDSTKRLVLYLRVSTYVNDVRIITCTRTKEEYYIQLRENLLDQWTGRYSVTRERCWEMAVLALRADKGDNIGGYFKAETYFPLWLIEEHGHDFIKKAMSAALLDISHLSKSEAMELFCQEATRPPYALNTHVYGMRRHKLDTVDRALFTISPTGVSISAVGEEGDKVLLKNLQWNKIGRLSFNRRKISITSIDSSTMSLFAQNENKARYLISLCRTVHQTLLGMNIHRLPRINEEEKNIDEAISASTSGVISECDRREVNEDIEEDDDEEEDNPLEVRSQHESINKSSTSLPSTSSVVDISPLSHHSPPSSNQSTISSSTPQLHSSSPPPPPSSSYPIYSLPGPSSSTSPLPIPTVYNNGSSYRLNDESIIFTNEYLPSSESISSNDSNGIRDTRHHNISLSLHDFEQNSRWSNSSVCNSNVGCSSIGVVGRLSSNSESRIDSLDVINHLYTPIIHVQSTSSHLSSSPQRTTTAISRVQSMPAHNQSMMQQVVYSSPLPSHRDPPPYDKATQALQRVQPSIGDNGIDTAAYPQPSLLSSSAPSSRSPISSLTIEELRRFPLLENMFREFSHSPSPRLTRYEPQEALRNVPQNDLPTPAPIISSNSYNESLYAMPPPPPYHLSSSLVK